VPVAKPSKTSELPVRSWWREYGEAFGMAILLALFIRTFVVQAFKIPSGSMLPTLQIGDHLLVNKFIYGIRIPFVGKRILEFRQPKRGDVIVFIYPEDRSKDFIKRVMGTPGDRIEVRDQVVFINGMKVDDPHASHDPPSPYGMHDGRDNFGPYVVPAHKVFVMGDNRDHSHDSRFWGPVDIDDILGKAFILYYSCNESCLSSWPRWSRIGMVIP
jgi:signal peptidase I